MTAPPAIRRTRPRNRYRIRNQRLEPTPWGRAVFGWYGARRRAAILWKRAALAIYRWIAP
jgi:hypothetical protein